jgi:hypothetical protein
MSHPDFRALCAEMLNWIERASQAHVYGTQDLITRARAALAVEPVGEGPTDEEVEEAAKLIHASMRLAVPDNHYTSDWVERGNSLMQDAARGTAHAIPLPQVGEAQS